MRNNLETRKSKTDAAATPFKSLAALMLKIRWLTVALRPLIHLLHAQTSWPQTRALTRAINHTRSSTAYKHTRAAPGTGNSVVCYLDALAMEQIGQHQPNCNAINAPARCWARYPFTLKYCLKQLRHSMVVGASGGTRFKWLMGNGPSNPTLTGAAGFLAMPKAAYTHILKDVQSKHSPTHGSLPPLLKGILYPNPEGWELPSLKVRRCRQTKKL